MIIIGILALLAGLVGLVGSVVPGLPGPPVSWVGMLLAFLAKGTDNAGAPMSSRLLIMWFSVMVVVSVMDYVIPSYFTKATGGSKWASRGTIVGLIVGLMVPPVGIILGGLAGAFLFEFIFADKGVWSSFKATLGAFMGFLCGTGVKLLASGMMMYHIAIFFH
ncbi:MAG: DUF456 domain-containing protein [Bacteroidales bacterium]|nr:DUF456 domain-containing protein [Bacteroidales bacterium]